MATPNNADQRSDVERRRRAAAGFVAAGGMAVGVGGLLLLLTSSADAVARTLLFVGAGALQLAGMALFVLAVLALLGRLDSARRGDDAGAAARQDRRQLLVYVVVGLFGIGIGAVLLPVAHQADGLLRTGLIAAAIGLFIASVGQFISAGEAVRRRRLGRRPD